MVPSKPVPIPADSSRPSRPKPQRSGLSFSSFIRKLTGRSASPSRTLPDPAVTSASSPRSRSTDPPQKPLLPKLDTRPQVGRAPSSASVPKSAPAQAILSPQTVAEVDPLNIPLPASPTSTPTVFPEPDERPVDFSLAPPIVSREPSFKRVKQTGMLSLQGFEFDEEDEAEALEEQDVVQPFEPIRIPSRSADSIESPTTPAPSTGQSEMVVTPTSDTEASSPMKERVTGSSPVRNVSPGLGRKESNFRKSVMGLQGVSPLPHIQS